MDPGRWREIERLYHAAVARPATEREAFLAEACAGDEALRHQVAELLDMPRTGDGLSAGPAVAAVVSMAADPDQSMVTGGRLGVYHLQERIGAGAMGEVYRARDTRLGRDVAIKILLRSFAADSDRVARFEREARLLAALNHPHIAAICARVCYPAWSSDGSFLYVADPVGGKTLAIPVPRGQSLPDLPAAGIDVAAGVAGLPGASMIEHGSISPGVDPSTYVFIRTDSQRNLYRIPLH